MTGTGGVFNSLFRLLQYRQGSSPRASHTLAGGRKQPGRPRIWLGAWGAQLVAEVEAIRGARKDRNDYSIIRLLNMVRKLHDKDHPFVTLPIDQLRVRYSDTKSPRKKG
jgi:hypothetical protein